MVQPWYKQFWAWFILLLILTTVFGTLLRVYILSQHTVSLVSEDYYKKGKGINVDLSRVNVAKEMQLGANVYSQDKQIIIELDKGVLANYPALNVEFSHRTLPDRDFNVLATANASGVYKIELESPLNGPWFIELMPHDQKWLIQGRMTFPSSQPVPLMK
ncbi:FixH family protein [Vibrio gallicus]|uniref:FixH family protein n=1 Tax=Vibrio gallicus TaxID=190897 RepID=UPI0021C3008C|nr:FixH family protein [Vibrio gallicus]